MNDLFPNNWVLIPFTDILDIQGGAQPPKSQFIYEPKKGYIRLLQIRDFGDRQVPTYVSQSHNLKYCNKEDILIGRYGASVGKILTGMEGAYNVALAKVIIPDQINYRYIYFFLQSTAFQEPILSLERSAQSGFNKSDLGKILLPIAPIQEQGRIVSKLDYLFTKTSSLKDRLDKIAKAIKSLKKSTFEKAIKGELTSDWRIENKISGNWKKLKLHEVIEGKPRNGYSPKGVNYKTDIKSLTLSATTSGNFDPTHIKYLDIDRPKKDSHLWLKKGDLLIQRSNTIEYVGISAVYTAEDYEFIYPDLMMKITPKQRLVLSKYLHLELISDKTRKYFRSKATGASSSMPKINQSTVMNANINVPSLEEQNQIIKKINEFQKYIDRLENRLNRGIEAINQISVSALNMAFTGDLTKQFSSDGSAQELIDNIKDNMLSFKKERLPKRLMNEVYMVKKEIMEILEVLQNNNGPMKAREVWKKSKYKDDIDAFYSALKKEVEERRIKESEDKEYLTVA